VLLVLLVLPSVPAAAHSYADPALRSVLDGVQPTALPAGASVEVVPSVVDELRITNTTAQPLEVLAVGGEPFLRVSSEGVLANLASPDWYVTGTPEGGPPLPPDVQRLQGKGPARWLRVSREPVWTEFDPRLRPQVSVPASTRAAGKEAVLAVWRIPLTYAGTMLAATGHVAFSPIRGGFTVAVGALPDGLTASPLQGELPGIFLKVPAGRVVVVQGGAGEPFLRFAGGRVEANVASSSWLADQRARGRAVAAASGVRWSVIGKGLTYAWLDPRLRYPADLPPEQALASTTPTVVQHWTVPLTYDGEAASLTGDVVWVPRALATKALRGQAPAKHATPVFWIAGGGLALALGLVAAWRRTT
jgi:hypothetical protein